MSRITLLASVLLFSLGAGPLLSQPSDDVTLLRGTALRLERPILSMLKLESRQGVRITVDPEYSVAGPNHSHRSIPSEALDAFRRVLPSEVRPLSEVIVHDPAVSGPSGYTFVNADAVLRISSPVIQRDTAFVDVGIRILRRSALTPTHLQVHRFTFVRAGAVWRFAKEEIIAIS